MSWIAIIIAMCLFSVLIVIKYIFTKKQKEDNPPPKSKLKKIVSGLISIVLDIAIFFVTTFGAWAAQDIIDLINAKQTTCINIIDGSFSGEYTLGEFVECKNIVLSNVTLKFSTEKTVEDNSNSVEAHSVVLLNTKESFLNELKYWKDKCSGSHYPLYYKTYANVAYDYCIFLYNSDEKDKDKDIFDNAKICINNFLEYIKYDTVSDGNISDSLYRIAQAYDVLSRINSDNVSCNVELFYEEMVVLSAIYFEIAHQFAESGSIYYNSISYYLADSYEKMAINCNNSNSLLWLERAVNSYTTAINEGYEKNECYRRLSHIYLKYANEINKYNMGDIGEYKSYNDYIGLSDYYKSLEGSDINV